MKGSIALKIGIILLIIIFMLFFLVFLCENPGSRGEAYCQPVLPLLEQLDSALGR